MYELAKPQTLERQTKVNIVGVISSRRRFATTMRTSIDRRTAKVANQFFLDFRQNTQVY